MSASRSHEKKWDDVKMVVAAAAVTATLALWNFFASADFQTKAIQPPEQVSSVPVEKAAEQPVELAVAPTPTPLAGKILMGGTAPQPRVVIQSGNSGKPVTQTRSS